MSFSSESSIAHILKTNMIPYDKQLNKKMASIYITPNVVILSYSFLAISRGSGFYKMIDRINKLSITGSSIIYLYLEKIPSDNEYRRFLTELYKKVNCEIVIITDINDIINIPLLMDYSFGIMHSGALWSLVMVDMHHIIMGRSIIVSSTVYNRAIAIMDDNELVRLHTYNIIISDDHYANLVYIIQDTHNNKERFTIVINFTPLDGGQRSAIRIIDGMTIQCQTCNKIIYIDKKHYCENKSQIE